MCLTRRITYFKHSVRSQDRWSDLHEARETIEDLKLDVEIQAAPRATLLTFDRCGELGVVDGSVEQKFPAKIGRKVQGLLLADSGEFGDGIVYAF